MGDYNRGFLYPYFLAVSSHPALPLITRLRASRTNTCFVCGQFALRLFNREKEKFRNSRVYPLHRAICPFVANCPIAAREISRYDRTYMWIKIREKIFLNPHFELLRTISRISRWEIKKKRKKIARLKIFKLKFPNWPRLLSIALKTNRPNCPNDEYNINRFDSISADTEIFLQLSNNCLVSPFAYSYRSWYDRNVWSKPRRYFAFREPRSMPGKTFILLVNVPEEKRLYFRGTKNMHARFHIVCLYHIYIYIILKNRVYQRVRVYTHARGNRYSPCQNVRHRSGGGGKIRLVKSGGTIINNSDTDYRLVSSVRLPRKRFKEFSMRMRYASMYR